MTTLSPKNSFNRFEHKKVQMSYFSAKCLQKGIAYEYGSNYFFTSRGSSSYVSFSSMYPEIQGASQSSKVLLPRSISKHGLCSTHLPRKLARHRSMSSSTKVQNLSHGHSRRYFTQHLGLCQRNARLENLRRLCSNSYSYRQTSLCRRRFWRRTQRNRLCTRCYNHRPVSFYVSLGSLSQTQGSGQAPYSIRPTRLYSSIYPYQRWKTSRCQCPRFLTSRTRRFLCHGQSLPRFHQTIFTQSRKNSFCYPRQIQLQISENLFPSCRQINGSQVRSNDCPDRFLSFQRLPGATQAHQVLRSRARQSFCFSDQQFSTFCVDDYKTLQMPMACGAFLQVDQTTLKNQKLLRDIRKRCENSNLDCRIDLCLGGDHEKETEAGPESLHNFADFKCHHFRENTHFIGL